jgi:hypothetical protein
MWGSCGGQLTRRRPRTSSRERATIASVASSPPLTLGEDIAADLGDPDAAGRALDEANNQIPLELSNPFAELRLGLADRARRGGEAAVAHHLREILQIAQVLQ